jgi:hypothetical protein
MWQNRRRIQLTPGSILCASAKEFSEDSGFIREGVASHNDSLKGKDIPVGAC